MLATTLQMSKFGVGLAGCPKDAIYLVFTKDGKISWHEQYTNKLISFATGSTSNGAAVNTYEKEGLLTRQDEVGR